MSVRRDLWERVGGFREGFGNVKSAEDLSWAGESRVSTAEDTEFCIRVSQAYPDLRWIYEPSARVLPRVPSHRSTSAASSSRGHARKIWARRSWLRQSADRAP